VALGPALGEALGTPLGDALRTSLGDSLGPSLGDTLGKSLGAALGTPLGLDIALGPPALGLGDELTLDDALVVWTRARVLVCPPNGILPNQLNWPLVCGLVVGMLDGPPVGALVV
jgi:hypothetical protein